MGSEVHAASSLCSELNVPVEVSSIQTDRGSSDPTKDDDGSKTEQDAVSYNTEEKNAKAEHSKWVEEDDIWGFKCCCSCVNM